MASDKPTAEGNQGGEGATAVVTRIQRAHAAAEEVEARVHMEMMTKLISNPKKAAAGLLTHILTPDGGGSGE